LVSPGAILSSYDWSEKPGQVIPFKTRMLGIELLVEHIDMNARDEIVAVCRNGNARQRIRFNLLDLPIPALRPVGAEWIEAYRQWANGLS
jgi:hypothetical protein